ncbi:MAG: RsmE family RNA methyltransferase [Candidatus Cryptobacteroides sp.]
MEIFYSENIEGRLCRLSPEESGHCVRVLRHRAGDRIHVIDGHGNMYDCRLTDDNPKGAEAVVEAVTPGWGAHPYRLVMAVCPTKNNDRFEWFAEKACEVGVDRIVPLVGEHSERRVFKADRLNKILISAAKQSLKGAVPEVMPLESVKDFVCSDRSELKLIAYCFEDENVQRRSIREVLEASSAESITVMIGPEGDFSEAEARLAIENGFVPVHLGDSRLRTETAALTAVEAVYFRFMK